MQFVDEEEEFDQESAADNPFAVSTEAEKRSPDDVAAYTAQWLEQADDEEEDIEDSGSEPDCPADQQPAPEAVFVIHTVSQHSSDPILPKALVLPPPSLLPEDPQIREYQVSMTSRTDMSSGNFQTGRLSPPPEDFGSNSSSEHDDEFKQQAAVLEDEAALEAETLKTGESPEAVVTRLSIQCKLELGKPAKDAEQRQAKARISIRPSLVPIPTPIVRMQGAILAEEMRNIREFLTRPLHPDLHLECRLVRNRSGFKRFFPVYSLTLEHTGSFLLAAKKRPNNKTSNYLISMSESDLKKNSAFYIGKLRSNFLGTEYCIYDNGLNPKKKKTRPEQHREQLGAVLYVRYKQHTKTTIAPKEVTVLLPKVERTREREIWKPKDVCLGRNMT
jgi:hypothetical protein